MFVEVWTFLHLIQHFFFFFNFTKHLTSNCLDNIICNAICKFSAIRFIRLKGLMESETSILFYFCDNTKNLLVGETKPDRSQDMRTPFLPQLRQPYDDTTKWQNNCQSLDRKTCIYSHCATLAKLILSRFGDGLF